MVEFLTEWGIVAHAAETAVAEITHTTTQTHEAAPHGAIHVTLAAEKVTELFGLPITNALITTWITMALLIGVAWFVRRRLALVPSRLQVAVEEGVTALRLFFSQTLESDDLARKFLPLLATIFLFVAVANTLNLMPGIGSLFVHTPHGDVPLLRGVNSDLNVTLALTIIAMVVIEFSGVIALGLFRYGGKFFNFSSPVNFFVGIVELIGEMARLVSFSFRLFGNIFAGKVLIAVIIFFVPYIVPVPVMAFEAFVGVVQGLIFMLLTLFFIKLAMHDPHEAHAH